MSVRFGNAKTADAKWQVFAVNALGQKTSLRFAVTSPLELEIEIGGLPAGAYIVSLFDGKQRFDKKLIVQ